MHGSSISDGEAGIAAVQPPNDLPFQLQVKCLQLPNSTLRCSPSAIAPGRSPGRSAPGCCKRLLGTTSE